MRVLIVEDDPRIVSFLEKGLAAEGYATTSVTDGDEAISLLSARTADVRARAPRPRAARSLGRGRAAGESVGATERLPVIILTARADVENKVKGLNLGANDYVTKPFSFAELLARMRTVAAHELAARGDGARRGRPHA